MRGPVVYCLESPDNPGVDLFALSLTADCKLAEELTHELGGTVRLKGKAWNASENAETLVTAIPYSLWANREVSTMRIWIPERV